MISSHIIPPVTMYLHRGHSVSKPLEKGEGVATKNDIERMVCSQKK